MNAKSGIVGFIFLIWLALCSYYYVCVMSGHCFVQRNASAETQPLEEPGLPPHAVWTIQGTDAVIVGDSFTSHLEAKVSTMLDDEVLNISGHYLSEEPNGFNRAFRRAITVKQLAKRILDTTRISLDVLSIAATGELGDTFEAASVHIVGKDAAEVTIDPPTDAPWQEENETSDKQQIGSVQFKSGSVVKKLKPGQEESLREFVVDMIDTKKQIYVIGHGYGAADEEENYQMGRKRAWAVKKMLWDMGLDPDRITTDSKGSKDPMSSNNASERVDIYTKDK